MPQHAIVIGAGLAGSSAAERLAARGWTIALIERAAAPGEGASGNLAGVLRPLPSLDDNRLARLTLAGFVHARAHSQALTTAGLPLRWGQTGVLHLARDEQTRCTQQRVVEIQQPAADDLRFVDRDEASQLAAGRWPTAAGGFPAAAGSIRLRCAGPTWSATPRRSAALRLPGRAHRARTPSSGAYDAAGRSHRRRRRC
jgi:tRNA 5-methylaminomethyl-2-thiouridine biosynthesis bifunctional protein